MSRKDFELIARVLREIAKGENIHVRDNSDANMRGIALAFADELAGTNPLFNRQRFLKACEAEG